MKVIDTNHRPGYVLAEMRTEELMILSTEIEFSRKAGGVFAAELDKLKLGESKVTDLPAPMGGKPDKKGTVGPTGGKSLIPGNGIPGGSTTAADEQALAKDLLEYFDVTNEDEGE